MLLHYEPTLNMKEEIEKLLSIKKRKKDFTRIKRKIKSGVPAFIERGLVKDYSTELIQFISVGDFKIEETIIFPTKDIKKIRFNKNDQYYNHILCEEKIQKSVSNKLKLNLENWKRVFETLNSDCIIVETERSKNRTFHIGGVIKIKKKGIEFLNFNAQGKFDKKTYLIKYKDITRLTADSYYAKVFSKYVKK